MSEAYLAGLIDSDGEITLRVKKNYRYRYGFCFFPQIRITQYIAGLIDGDGCLDVQIYRNRNFGILPRVRLTESKIIKLEELLRRFRALGVHPKVYRDRNNIIISIVKIGEVKNLLQKILPFLVIKREQAEILLYEIIPRLEKFKHKSKDGFLEIMGFVDRLRELNCYNGLLKYTKKYFETYFSRGVECDH